MSEYEYIRNDRLRSILDNRIDSSECCECCQGEPGGSDEYKLLDCNTCDVRNRFEEYINNLYNEIISEPYRDPLDDNAVNYMNEFLCPVCIYQVNVECGGSYWEPPDYEPMCSITNRFKYGRIEDDCFACKGQFFKQNPKEDPIELTYNQWIGIDPYPEGNDDND